MFEKKKIYRAYREVFDLESPTVRVVMQDLCAAHGVFDGGFNPEPYKNAFVSGERNVILRILAIINLKAQDVVNLANEEVH